MLAVGGWVDVSTQTMAGADGAGQGSSREGEGWHMEVAGVGPDWAVGQGSSESRSAQGAPQQQFGSVNKLTLLVYDVMRWICEKDGICGGEKVGVNEKDLGDFSMPASRPTAARQAFSVIRECEWRVRDGRRWMVHGSRSRPEPKRMGHGRM